MGVSVVNDGPVHVVNHATGQPRGWTVQWALGSASVHLCPDTYITTAEAEALRLVAVQQGRTSWEAALPSSWASWFTGLGSGRRDDVFESWLLHPPIA